MGAGSSTAVFFTGKGGVGRATVKAGLYRAAALATRARTWAPPPSSRRPDHGRPF